MNGPNPSRRWWTIYELIFEFPLTFPFSLACRPQVLSGLYSDIAAHYVFDDLAKTVSVMWGLQLCAAPEHA